MFLYSFTGTVSANLAAIFKADRLTALYILISRFTVYIKETGVKLKRLIQTLQE